jgi:hypothetical protein
LSDRVEEVDVDVQTDAFLDRPPSPLFIPAKTGVDVETQIYEGDLFDFNLEVKPILEVLIGKTIEQSLLEVMEEEELANLRKQQREYEELRNAEKVEQQRLEEQERRLREEKHRRMKQAADVLKLEKETAEKLAAKAFAKSYLADLVPSVFNNLRENGYFYDPVNRDLELGFMPWIMNQTLEELDQLSNGRLILDTIIREVVNKREIDYKNLKLNLSKLSQQSLNNNEEEEQQQELDENQNVILSSESNTNLDNNKNSIDENNNIIDNSIIDNESKINEDEQQRQETSNNNQIEEV